MTPQRIEGTWLLKTWRRIEDDGNDIYPLGENPRGILVYTPDGSMVVQMFVQERPKLDTDDPVAGSVDERAAAYSTCLAYFGTYEVQSNQVVHEVECALFPNWSNTRQARPFMLDGKRLALQVKSPEGRLTNEIIWERKKQ